MKKFCAAVLIVIAFGFQNVFANFYARNLTTSQQWWANQILKFESKTELNGLFYESTINLKLKLGKDYRWDLQNPNCQNPYSGKYEFVWNFSLPKNSYVKDLQVWNQATQSFEQTEAIDLSTGEQAYNPSSTDRVNVLFRQFMRRNYNGDYDLQYDLRISPVNWDESTEFIIKIISPCEIKYNKRIVQDYCGLFNTGYYSSCFTNAPINYFVVDYNNPTTQPQNFVNAPLTWTLKDNFWQSTSKDVYSLDYWFPVESNSGKFLQTYSDSSNNFYQLSTLPFISEELRYPRKIVLAFDLVQQKFNDFTRSNFINMLKDAIIISTTEKDSVAFLTSDFNVKWLSTVFEKRSETLITNKLNTVAQTIPKLNTLPYMLKEIVQFLNNKNTPAEVWLVSDDFQTGNRAETVMELIQQTFYKTKNNIVFKIIDAASSYYSYYIQNKYYYGNAYLYENLSRLSGGNFNTVYDKYYAYQIDEVLDCFAPTVSTVEIDPVISNGFTYSRINLNGSRNNFNLTTRYGQLGLMEHDSPITVNYFGNYLGGSYFNAINLTKDNSPAPDNILKNIDLYWFGYYIINDLFMQPQSYTTIKYIEQLSVENHLLTPYSAFVIPNISGYFGYKRIYTDDAVTDIEEDYPTKEITLPDNINLSSYPNPFNPTTTITIKLQGEIIQGEKKLDIYDILGRRIKSFDLSEFKNSSQLQVEWNGLNDSGQQVSSGTYIAVFKTGTGLKTFKLLLIR